MRIASKFASAVLEARTRLGYTQSQVAEAVSVSVRWYQKVESGRKLPGTVTALRIILFLEIDVENFREEVGLVEPIQSAKRELALK